MSPTVRTFFVFKLSWVDLVNLWSIRRAAIGHQQSLTWAYFQDNNLVESLFEKFKLSRSFARAANLA